MSLLLWILALLLIAVGIAGTLVPFLPGALLVFLGMLLGAWADGFSRVGALTLVLLAGLTALVYLLDLLGGALGARRVGAGPRAFWGAALGGLVGLFFGLPGILLGPLLGAVLGEYTVRRSLASAGRAGAGTWLGLALAAAAQIALVFTMLGVFAAAYLFD